MFFTLWGARDRLLQARCYTNYAIKRYHEQNAECNYSLMYYYTNRIANHQGSNPVNLTRSASIVELYVEPPHLHNS